MAQISRTMYTYGSGRPPVPARRNPLFCFSNLRIPNRESATNFRTSSEMIVGLAEVSYSPAHNLSSYSIVANGGADGRLRDRRRLGPRERLHDQVHPPLSARHGRPSLDTRQRHGYDMRWMETTQTMDLLWFRLRKYANPLIFVMDLAAAAKYGRGEI